MRGTDIQGRFSIDYEATSLWEGIRDELASPVGVEVDWFAWDQEFLEANIDLVTDDIYDTSNPTPGLGRRWKNPVRVPVITAQIYQGMIQQNDRGFYNTDTLRVVINVEDALKFFPDLTGAPDARIKDRIVFRNEVFTPIRVNPRGHLNYMFAVVTIDCAQVNAEELVNDPQFQKFAGGNDPLDIVPCGPPRNVTATVDAPHSASVTWSAPLVSGGSPVRSYLVATDDGSISKTVSGTSATFTDLTSGVAYKFAVVANTRAGGGAVSELSNEVLAL